MRPFTVLHVPATAATIDECTRETVENIRDLQRLVGGYVEEAHLPAAGGVVMYGDEDGLTKDSPTNLLATSILSHYSDKAGEERLQRVAGDVVFASYTDEAGAGDVAEDFLADVRANARPLV